MQSKGDLSINTIFVLVIAIISIFLLLSLFAVRIPFFSKELYCKTFFHIQKSTFVPSGLRADQSYCKFSEALTSLKGNHTNVYNETAAAAIGCWQLAEYGRASEHVVCTQIIYKANETIKVTEENITQVIIDNQLCDVLANNDTALTCGSENQLEVQNFTLTNVTQLSVLIEYDNSSRMIIVS